ncbi:hypothetical protein MTO96_006958 [Rhipicephalus appendiculatus]
MRRGGKCGSPAGPVPPRFARKRGTLFGSRRRVQEGSFARTSSLSILRLLFFASGSGEQPPPKVKADGRVSPVGSSLSSAAAVSPPYPASIAPYKSWWRPTQKPQSDDPPRTKHTFSRRAQRVDEVTTSLVSPVP